MTLRKLTLATVATIALTSSAFAADQTTSAGQWGVGGAFNFSAGASADPALQVTYLNSQFIVQGNVGYKNVSGNVVNGVNVLPVTGDAYTLALGFGLRNMLNNQVSFDYGLAGNYGFLTNLPANSPSYKNPYSIGAFVGVDFMPVQSILLTAAISPYTYSRDPLTLKHNYVFTTGNLGVSYMF